MQVLTILAKTETKKRVESIINSIDRLNELVDIVTNDKPTELLNKTLVVTEDGLIKTSLDWNDTEPPYLFPELVFSKENFLALVFYKLGNHQKSFEFLSEENPFYYHFLIATHLKLGYDINETMCTFAKTNSKHNYCIIQQYGDISSKPKANKLKTLYKEAISDASNDELRLFIIKHFVNFLLDTKAYLEAEKVLRLSISKAISEDSKNAIKNQLATVLMAQLKLPHNVEQLAEIQDLQQTSIAYYEARELKVNAGLILIDASEVANFQENFVASESDVNKAMLYFKEAGIPEFFGEARLRKATLLYTWSKKGSPQYYKHAINAFQDALKIFKKDTHPQKFSEIHHNLALIYSEIPVSSEEKPIWTAFCASSFKEVLEFYKKEQYPYEYAMASHNYATALMNFPKAKLNNNLDKAFSLFEDALTVRTIEKYPFERALTLLNQLELYWLMHNEDEDSEMKKYNDMVKKATSIIQTIEDKELRKRADKHLNQLKNLKTILN